MSLLSSERNGETEKDALVARRKEETWREELVVIVKMAIPIGLAHMARVANYSVDTAFLGHQSTDKLAAAALSWTVFQLVSSFVYSPTDALSSLCSQAIGAGNHQLAGRWLQIGITVATLMAIPACLVFWNVDFFLQVTERDEKVLRLARRFSRIAMLIPFPTLLSKAMRQFFQALQIVYPATFVMVLSVFINICLNWVLIRELGYIGSPLATFLGVCFQAGIFYLYTVCFKKYNVGSWDGNPFDLKTFWRERGRLKAYMKVVIPVCVADMSMRWALQLVTLQAAKLPSADMAAIQITGGISALMGCSLSGFVVVTTVRVGRCIGKGDIAGAKMVMRLSLISSLSASLLVCAVVIALRKYIAMIYTHDEKVQRQLVAAIPVVCVCFLSSRLARWSSAVLEGCSKNKLRFYITLVDSWFVYLPLTSYLAYHSSLRHKFHPIVIIYSCRFLAQMVNATLMCAVLFRADWNQSVADAKVRSEMNVKKKTLLCEDSDASVAVDELISDSDDGERLYSGAKVSMQEVDTVGSVNPAVREDNESDDF